MLKKSIDAARIGLTAHAAVLHKLVSLGFEVLQPFGDHLRYDLAYYHTETAELICIEECPIGDTNLRIESTGKQGGKPVQYWRELGKRSRDSMLTAGFEPTASCFGGKHSIH